MGLRPDPEFLEPLDSDQTKLVERLRSRLGEGIRETQSFRKQLSIWIRPEDVLEALRFSKTDPQLLCDLLCDLTAVDYYEQRAQNEPRFEVVYNLYSITFNRRFFLKVGLNDGEALPSATAVWRTADYFEREIWDLFGIRFDGHPNLERILTADGWIGHPLRKDFPTFSDQFPNVEA